MNNSVFTLISKKASRSFSRFKKFFGKIGPGFVTGAADDDPSGVGTYTIAGAKYGYGLTWMTLFLLPAMIAIQEMCGRIGLVTGKGLAGVIKTYYSNKVLWFSVSLLAFANVVNIGANLGIMASSAQMLLPFPVIGKFPLGEYFWLILMAIFIIWLEVTVTYKRYSELLKWLSLSLLVYVFTAFLVRQDWGKIFFLILVPHVEFSMGYLMTVVGFLGTTISPYLFFWQASQEVEERIASEKISDFNEKPVTHMSEVKAMRLDTKMGMIFSNIMTFFIILTAAGTLHANGIFEIESPQQAAMMLKPLAGDFAYFLFAFGMIGIGLQSIPVLAGSLAYAVSDALGIEEGLSKNFSNAKGFYVIIALATLAGSLMNLLGINTIQALYYAAIVNGVMAVPLIFIIIRMSSDSRIVDGFRTKKKYLVIAWITFAFMALSVVAMLASMLLG